VRFLELLVEWLGVRMGLLGVFKGLDGFLEEVLRELGRGLGEEGWERVGVDGQGGDAVGNGFFVVFGLGREVSLGRESERREEKREGGHLCVCFAGGFQKP